MNLRLLASLTIAALLTPQLASAHDPYVSRTRSLQPFAVDPSSACCVCPSTRDPFGQAFPGYPQPLGQQRGLQPLRSPYANPAPFGSDPGYLPRTRQPLRSRFVDPPRRSRQPLSRSPLIPRGMSGISKLPVEDQRLALAQRTCPVTGDLLGSMGRPIKLSFAGRTTFVCCQGCVEDFNNNPHSTCVESRGAATPPQGRGLPA